MLPRLWQVKKFLRPANFRQRHFGSNAETVQGEASIAQNALPFRPARRLHALCKLVSQDSAGHFVPQHDACGQSQACHRH